MKNQDFTTTLLVDQSPLEVFHAVNDPRNWWSENITGATDVLHGEFNYHYKDVHLTRMRIEALVPGQQVVWYVISNYFNFVEDKREWTGTRIVFDIARKGAQTELRFTHEGLVPAFECYQVCNDAWSHFIGESLRNLIVTGKGMPSPKDEGEGFNSALIEKWQLEER